VRFLAAASSALRRVLAGPARPAHYLGAARGALYLRTAEPPGVLVVLSHDAVRLPCGLLLPATSAELPLSSLVPPPPAVSAALVVGDNAVSWTGPAGPVVVRAARGWAPSRPPRGQVTASALAAVRACPGLDNKRQQPWREPGADRGVDHALLADLAAAGDHNARVAEAARLIGRGPGLTPAGDDVLVGFLVGAAAFGLDAALLRRAIALLAPARTTALSAALLWHAARGECIDELAAVAAVLTSQPACSPEQTRRAVSQLLAVGHSSGVALALGLVTAADSAQARQAGRAA
jgi:hypothetical protein